MYKEGAMIKILKGFTLLSLIAIVLLSIAYGLGILLHIFVPDIFFNSSRLGIFLGGYLTLSILGLVISLGVVCYQIGEKLSKSCEIKAEDSRNRLLKVECK